MIDQALRIRPFVAVTTSAPKPVRIDEKNLAKLLENFWDKTYTDKEMAVVREYATNAIDAMTVAGKSDRAIFVHCPTVAEPYFSVRDFGYGMSPEEMDDVFNSLGETTKNRSNDLIGMMGIGSKAGFAYSDAFNVINYDGDTKTTYTVQKNATGGAETILIGQTSCLEESGLEVIVYVEQNDISRFEQKIRDFQRFCLAPIESNITFEKVERVFPNPEDKTYFRIKDHNCGSGVLMGNIRYAFDPNQLGYDLPYEAKRFCANTTFIVPIGSVSFATSRESLEYSSGTVAFLKKMILDIRTRAKAYIDAQIAKVDNVIDALELSDLAADFQYHIGNFKVGEHTVKDLQTYLRACSTAVVMKNGKVSRSMKGRYSYDFRKDDTFVRVDEHPDMKKRVCARAWSLKNSTGRVFLIAENPDYMEGKITIPDLNLNMVMLSSIPVPKIVRVVGESAPRKTGFVRGLYTLNGRNVSWESLEDIEDEEKFIVNSDGVSEELLKEAGYDLDFVFRATDNFIERKVEGFTVLDYAAAKATVMAKYAHLSDAIAFYRSSCDDKLFEKVCGVKVATVCAVPDFIRSAAHASDQSNAWLEKYKVINDLRRFGNEVLGRNYYDKRLDFADAMLPHIEAFKASQKS